MPKRKVEWFPKSAADLDALKTAPVARRQEVGMALWESVEAAKQERVDNEKAYRKYKFKKPPLPEKGEIWLFPKEWYNFIPEGYEVITIMWETHKFSRGKSDNDTRFGMLSFGVLCDA